MGKHHQSIFQNTLKAIETYIFSGYVYYYLCIFLSSVSFVIPALLSLFLIMHDHDWKTPRVYMIFHRKRELGWGVTEKKIIYPKSVWTWWDNVCDCMHDSNWFWNHFVALTRRRYFCILSWIIFICTFEYSYMMPWTGMCVCTCVSVYMTERTIK